MLNGTRCVSVTLSFEQNLNIPTKLVIETFSNISELQLKGFDADIRWFSDTLVSSFITKVSLFTFSDLEGPMTSESGAVRLDQG